MLPKPPPREASLGFLYIPPFRVFGTTIAGEASSIMVPELDVTFDMGACPRPMLASKIVALSHGHMDHVGGLAYYCSQRHFQGMGAGTIVCDERIAPAIHKMMAGYVDLEQQHTPYSVVPLKADQPFEVKSNVFLRGFAMEHTVPTFGYCMYERRTKLKPELTGLPQEKLVELKSRGQDITNTHEIPLLSYLMDTAPGAHLIRPDVLASPIVIAECTFFEPEHKERAKVGKHLHLDDVSEWLGVLQCQKLVLTHLSRRTNIAYARQRLRETVDPRHLGRVEILMDHRANKLAYERQLLAAGGVGGTVSAREG
ncbi:MAG: hypothetical protein JNM07_10120 [Phycisphaerae bacterium]|nr:hypothetical protein [Phycisphaerae bacterium]